ncbi:MAG: homocysteine S-methyltransferase family protein [Planctomycetota bacterium]
MDHPRPALTRESFRDIAREECDNPMALSIRDYGSSLRIADGDWRLELSARVPSPLSVWDHASLLHPDMVRLVADAFLDAGADLLTTHTPRANTITMQGHIAAGKVAPADLQEMNRQWAALCRAAVKEHPAKNRLVLGTLGPVEPLLTLAEIDTADLERAYAEQSAALAEGGVDAILCREFTELDALLVAVTAAEKTRLPIIACMTFDSASVPPQTALGITIAQAVAALTDAGVAAVGCDTGDGPESMIEVVTAMRKATELPIWATICPSSPQLVEGQVVYLEKPGEFASRLSAIKKAGANFIAGGRGATAEHITALATARK